MIVYPAIDLSNGRCVQWVGGRPETERVSLPDPVAVARQFVDAGFAALHVVDLDAALGNDNNRNGNNRSSVAAILAAVGVPVQVGGGLRDDDAVAAVIALGAARAVVGTRAVADRPWLARMAAAHPGRIVVAADCRRGEVVTHGWTEGSGVAAADFVAGLAELPLAGILVTDVGREGRLGGPDVAFLGGLARASKHPLLAAGGIRGGDDIASLATAGIAGAILGMALYEGGLDPASLAATLRIQETLT